MSKILLILILFQPATGKYQDNVAAFDTMKECVAAKKEIQARKKGDPNVFYVLVCEKSKPTFIVQG